jgi:hypothetical protein
VRTELDCALNKYLRGCGQFIEGLCWLILHLLGHILLILSVVATLINSGAIASATLIRELQTGILKRMSE